MMSAISRDAGVCSVSASAALTCRRELRLSRGSMIDGMYVSTDLGDRELSAAMSLDSTDDVMR